MYNLFTIDNEPDFKPDKSGIYTLVSYNGGNVRVDIMNAKTDYPIKGYKADNIGKLTKTILKDYKISVDHALYIGAEIARAFLLKENYIQD